MDGDSKMRTMITDPWNEREQNDAGEKTAAAAREEE